MKYTQKVEECLGNHFALRSRVFRKNYNSYSVVLEHFRLFQTLTVSMEPELPAITSQELSIKSGGDEKVTRL